MVARATQEPVVVQHGLPGPGRGAGDRERARGPLPPARGDAGPERQPRGDRAADEADREAPRGPAERPATSPCESTTAASRSLIVDTDTSIEGWIRACEGLDFTPPCDGAHVVNQPIGAQSWFPSNNYPTDKAAFDTIVTVPDGSTAFGVGELASRRSRGGRTTWHWHEDDPTATYLTTATVGTFDYTQTTLVVTAAATLPVYNGIDSSYDADPEGERERDAGAGAGDAQLPARLVRHLPVRLDRGGRRPRARRRLRAGGADEVALLAAGHDHATTSATARCCTRSRTSGSATR